MKYLFPKKSTSGKRHGGSGFSNAGMLCVLLIVLILGVMLYYQFFLKTDSPSDTVPSATPSPVSMLSDSNTPSDVSGVADGPSETALAEPSPLPAEEMEQLILSGFSRLLSGSEISSLCAEDLSILYYGLYAVSGLRISSVLPDSESYFSQFSWYSPNETDPSAVKARFNDYQRQNTALIQTFRDAPGF